MNKIHVSKLIVKLTHGCKTWCNLCIEWLKKDIEFFTADEVTELMKTIDKSLDVIDGKYLSIFTFYGSSVLRHPDITKLIDHVQSILPHVTFCLDIGDVVPFDQNYMDHLLDIQKRYPVIYVFVRNLTDMGMLRHAKDWAQFFNFLHENPWFLSIPPSIRYNDKDYIALKVLKKVLGPYEDKVIPVYAKHPYPDHAARLFHSEKLWTETCKYNTYLEKQKETGVLVFGHEENEVNLMLDGALTMHTNICYLSKYRYITNVNHPPETVSDEIDEFVSNLAMVNAGWVSLKEACYRCIYWINKN